MASLVIVESPAKAKTISRILGSDFLVEASYGHIRDLPEQAKQIPTKYKKEKWARLGVNVEDGFEPLYVVPDDKKKYVKRLKDLLKGADEVLLATDEDREGESISWHVLEVLRPKVPTKRIAFHEITAEAIRAALESPREIDENLVRAQESRRILDRLFGYTLSPVLWKKVKPRLSAGRVQSVAVRLIVMRERERRAFRMARYCDAEAELAADGKSFTAKLARVDGTRLANGQDFEQTTGQMRSGVEALWLKDEDSAQALVDTFRKPWSVAKVEQKPFTRHPAAPFTTSSMQQEANRKLGFSAQRTMRVAQRLYEGIDLDGERVGIITYMRTDSTTLAERALDDAQKVITDMYGKDYTDGPRRYKTKSSGAQEAHEAVRPTELARTPDMLEKYLGADEKKLYELIWKRTVASQMTDAQLLRTAVEIEVPLEDGRKATFTTSGKTIKFPGFLRAYVEGSDDPDAEIADKEVVLPPLDEGQEVEAKKVEIKAHETTPPARYTEASLVKKLEAEGIGRPSTYASIIETVQHRGYIVKNGKALVPTFTAFAVTQLLEGHFSEYVDIKFTARLEDELDEIAAGQIDFKKYLERFYHGNGQPGLESKIAAEEDKIDYPEVLIGSHPDTGNPVVVKVGRYGPYLTTGEEDARMTASVPPDIPPADLKLDMALEILKKKSQGPRNLGVDPDTGLTVYLTVGRFGPYVQLGENPEKGSKEKPKRASIPKGMDEDEVDFALAMKWLSLPREVGKHPESGEPILATKGRFGPYIKCGTETRSLENEDQIFDLTLEQAVEKLNQPKTRGRRSVRKVLKELGADPNNGANVQVLDGPYGPYVTNTELNASLPTNVTVDKLTLEQAMEILAERGKAPKRRAAKATTRKKAAKKTAKKKTAKKKTAAKKKTKRKTTKKKAEA